MCHKTQFFKPCTTIDQSCIFYPSGQPSRYVDCIQNVLNCLLDDLNGTLDAPLIVNTMGWVRDVGAMLLIDIIRTVSEAEA